MAGSLASDAHAYAHVRSFTRPRKVVRRDPSAPAAMPVTELSTLAPQRYAAIVVGAPADFSYRQLCEATAAICDGADYILTNADSCDALPGGRCVHIRMRVREREGRRASATRVRCITRARI